MPHPVFSGPASEDYCSPGDRFPYAPRVPMFPRFSTRVSSRAQRLVQHKHRTAWKGHRFIIHGGNTQPVKVRDSFPFLKGQLCSRIKSLLPTMVIWPLINCWLYPCFVWPLPLLDACSWDQCPDQLPGSKSVSQRLLLGEPNLKHVQFMYYTNIFFYVHSLIEKLQSLTHYEIELVTCIISYFYCLSDIYFFKKILLFGRERDHK